MVKPPCSTLAAIMVSTSAMADELPMSQVAMLPLQQPAFFEFAAAHLTLAQSIGKVSIPGKCDLDRSGKLIRRGRDVGLV